MYHKKNSFTLIFCAFILFNLLHFTSYGQKTWKLDVEGNVRDEDSKEVMKGAKIEITKGGSPFKTIYADDNGNFNYSLDPDNSYTVKVSIGSYVSKIITISTENTPSDEEVKQNFKAKTEFRIFKRIADIDYSVLDSPIGSIFFDPVENKFDYSVVDFDLKKKLEELKKEMEKKKGEQAAKEKTDKEAAIKHAAFSKDSLAKADADAKKKAVTDAEETKKKASADAKAELDAKKKVQADTEAAKKKATADSEAAKTEEKRKALADAESAKTDAKKKAEQDELEKINAKRKAEQDELDKVNAKKKAEQEELEKVSKKKKTEQEELAAANVKKKAEQAEQDKIAVAKKKADDEEKKKKEVKPPPTTTVKNEPPVVRLAPVEKPIESAPPEIVQPESVRYDEFDYGTYHVNRTFVTIGGTEIEYQKIKHQWGGIFYKRDGLDMTDGTYKKEMHKYGLKVQ